MKRFVVGIAGLASFAMLNLGCSVCYFLMLACEPSLDCIASENVGGTTCESKCSAGSCRDMMPCEPIEVDRQIVCVIPISTDFGLNQTCGCAMESPLTSTPVNRKAPDFDYGKELNIHSELPQVRIHQRAQPFEARLPGIHLTIATTVLRC